MKIYVGNLAHAVNQDQLKDLFTQYGDVVSAKIITDKFTGNSRGFGFVEMSTRDEGEKAMEALNGSEHEGRRLTVNEAREQQDRPRRTGGGGGGFNRGGGRSGGGSGGWGGNRY